ncbi:MAG: alpha/beta fold hydrolase [Deltaproteobacteria bacterium]|nr:alpha/beta fold hydrolase [Deltaproteobacteria bacterium]
MSPIGLLLGAVVGVSLGGCAVDFVLFNGQPLDSYGYDAYAGQMLDREALRGLDPVLPGAIRQVQIESGAERLAAVLLADSDVGPDDTLIVFFHGSAQHLDYYWARTRLLHATGYPTLVVDYRGYGVSTGSTDVSSLLEDARATLDFVDRELGAPEVVIYGNSIGCLAAGHVAQEQRPRALILEVPPNSLETMVADQFGTNVPPEALFERNVSVRDDTAASAVPLLLFAADQDAVFPPVRHADPVFAHYEEHNPGRGEVERVAGGHDDVPRLLGYDVYVERVRTFVDGL